MMCVFASSGLSRVAEATLVKPTLQGAVVSWYGLVAVGLSAATLSSLGIPNPFFVLPNAKARQKDTKRPPFGDRNRLPAYPVSSKHCLDVLSYRHMSKRPFGDVSFIPVQPQSSQQSKGPQCLQILSLQLFRSWSSTRHLHFTTRSLVQLFGNISQQSLTCPHFAAQEYREYFPTQPS